MAGKLRRGFKAEAERIAVTIRKELSLTATQPLRPEKLAEHLRIPVVRLTDLTRYGFPERCVQYFLGEGLGDFSAMTLVQGASRLIVYNPAHSPGRCSSSLAHELSHVVLKHEPTVPFGVGGCRHWSADIEAEADWMAGVLLVPRAAALSIVRAQTPLDVSAQSYGVSVTMMRWRLNSTGALRQAGRERARRKRG